MLIPESQDILCGIRKCRKQMKNRPWFFSITYHGYHNNRKVDISQIHWNVMRIIASHNTDWFYGMLSTMGLCLDTLMPPYSSNNNEVIPQGVSGHLRVIEVWRIVKQCFNQQSFFGNCSCCDKSRNNACYMLLIFFRCFSTQWFYLKFKKWGWVISSIWIIRIQFYSLIWIIFFARFSMSHDIGSIGRRQWDKGLNINRHVRTDSQEFALSSVTHLLYHYDGMSWASCRLK